MLLVYLCYLCVGFHSRFPEHDVLTPMEKKGMGGQRATNLYDRPVPSSIARDRSLQSTSGKYKRQGTSDTVKAPLHERVQQFPDENFIVSYACRQILSTKKSVLKIHVSSKKHQDGKQKMKRSKRREQTIAKAF